MTSVPLLTRERWLTGYSGRDEVSQLRGRARVIGGTEGRKALDERDCDPVAGAGEDIRSGV